MNEGIKSAEKKRMSQEALINGSLQSALLFDSEEFQQKFFEIFPDAVIAHNGKEIVYCNQAALDLFKIKNDTELIGSDPLLLAHPGEREDIKEKRNEATTNNKFRGAQVRRFLKSDGSEFYSRNFYMNTGTTESPVFLLVFQDITQPIATERALKLGEKQFERSFEDSRVGMAILELDWRIRHANPALATMLETSKAKLAERSLEDLLSSEDLDGVRAAYQNSLEDDMHSFQSEARYRSGDGGYKILSTSISFVRDSDGHLSHLIGQFEDATKTVQENQIQQKYQLALSELHKITFESDLSTDKKIERVLDLGITTFELESALVGELDENNYRVLFAAGLGAEDSENVEMPAPQTYCFNLLHSTKPLSVNNVSTSFIADQECYQLLGFEAYFGTPIFVGESRLGTLCFSSREPRHAPFSELEESLLRLMSQWIGNELLQKQMSSALRDSSERYRAALQSAVDAIFVHDQQGRFIEVNEGACSSLGYSREELLALSVDDIEGGVDEEQVRQNRTNMETSGFYTSPGLHRHKDGSTFPVEVRVSEVNLGGDLYRLAVARNVSERDQNIRKLLESEARFRSIFEEAGAGMVVTELDGTIRHVNQAYADMFGWSVEEFVGKPVLFHVHPEEIEETQNAILKLKSGNNIEKRLFHRDGSTVWTIMNRSIIHDADGAPTYRMVQLQNITPQKLAQFDLEERRKHQDLLRITADTANTANSVHQAMNGGLQEICNLTGWAIGHIYYCSPGDAQLLTSSGIWFDTDSERFGAIREATSNAVRSSKNGIMAEMLKNQEARAGILRDFGPPGSRRHELDEAGIVATVKSPIFVGADVAAIMEFFLTSEDLPDEHLLGTIQHVCAQIGRVVERDQASRSLAEAKREAEAASRAKSEFLANMSHELRSPLTAIIGFAEAMQEGIFGPLGSDKYKEYTENILHSGEHLRDIINDILDVSAIESSQINMIEEDVDLDPVIQSSIRIISQRADEGDVRILNRVPNSVPRIYGDARRLKQIFVNVLSNAVRFTKPGGTVSIECRNEASGSLTFCIEDTGIGMSEDGIRLAMSVFGQVESDFSRSYEGTGLGIPLTKGLVESHQGNFRIESELGVGTRVLMTFPADRLR